MFVFRKGVTENVGDPTICSLSSFKQPVKALAPTNVTVPGIRINSKLLSENESSPMFVSVIGSIMFVNVNTLENAAIPMLVVPLKIISCILLHL